MLIISAVLVRFAAVCVVYLLYGTILWRKNGLRVRGINNQMIKAVFVVTVHCAYMEVGFLVLYLNFRMDLYVPSYDKLHLVFSLIGWTGYITLESVCVCIVFLLKGLQRAKKCLCAVFYQLKL